MAFDVVTYGLCKSYVNRYISSSAPTTWAKFRNSVRAGTIDNYFAPADQFNIVTGATSPFGAGNLLVEIADISDSTTTAFTPVDAAYWTNFPSAKPVTLLMYYAKYGAVFDAPEANYKITKQIDSAAKCVISLGYGTTATSNFRFTASKNLVVGGLIRYKSATEFYYYATASSSSETMAMTAGEVGDGYADIATSLSTQNDLNRAQYGSNRYTSSAIRQWLNSEAAAGSVWASTNDYDLPPSWNTTWPGFKLGLDADFLAVVGATTREVEKNTVTDGGGNEDISDLFFLPSRKEIIGTAETVTPAHTGAQFDVYVGSADADKIKYDVGAHTTARIWWLRSPYVSNATNARTVNTDGTLGSNSANYGNGAAAACVIL